MTEGRDWAMLAVLCLAGLLSGVLEMLFVPLYVGSVLVPVVVVAAVAGNVLLPRLGRALVASTAGLVTPFVAWLIPVLGLALFPRPEGDVIIAGGGGQQYVFYGVLFGGCIAGFASIVVVNR